MCVSSSSLDARLVLGSICRSELRRGGASPRRPFHIISESQTRMQTHAALGGAGGLRMRGRAVTVPSPCRLRKAGNPWNVGPQRACAARATPSRGAGCSTGAARACPGAAACSKSAARAHSLKARSNLALEIATRKLVLPVLLLSASTFARLHLASGMLCTYSHLYLYLFFL